MRLLRRSSDDLGVTVLMVTHDPVCASYGERVVRLVDGQMVEDIDVTEGASEEMSKHIVSILSHRRQDG